MSATLSAAISGLGMAGLVRNQPLEAGDLALQAIDLALADSGLQRSDMDGLLLAQSPVASDKSVNLKLQQRARLRNLSLLQVVEGEGTSALQMLHTAAFAVTCGMARHVVCVFADAPLRGGRTGAQAFGTAKSLSGVAGLRYSSGIFGAPALFAMSARRHMALYGTRPEHFGTVAVAARAWASMNPRAVFRDPLTLEDYFAGRPIAEPFRLHDCAIPVDGGIAVIVSAVDAFTGLKQPPVHILGVGQGHPATVQHRDAEDSAHAGVGRARTTAFAMARISLAEVDMAHLYDAFTYMSLVALEEYGFCARGEAGPFVAGGNTSPGGSLPVNTGGGHLSGYYLQGMTPLSEAIIQVRGQAGARQCKRHDVALVTNVGGNFDYHACAILGSRETRP